MQPTKIGAKHTKESRPLVRCPKKIVGKWNGYTIVLKSSNPLEDQWKFDKESEAFKKWLSSVLTQL